jgi:hypothetical protein
MTLQTSSHGHEQQGTQRQQRIALRQYNSQLIFLLTRKVAAALVD